MEWWYGSDSFHFFETESWWNGDARGSVVTHPELSVLMWFLSLLTGRLARPVIAIIYKGQKLVNINYLLKSMTVISKHTKANPSEQNCLQNV